MIIYIDNLVVSEPTDTFPGNNKGNSRKLDFLNHKNSPINNQSLRQGPLYFFYFFLKHIKLKPSNTFKMTFIFCGQLGLMTVAFTNYIGTAYQTDWIYFNTLFVHLMLAFI